MDNHIDGVIAGASEFNIDKVRKLTKKLGMPLYCKNDSAWNTSRNKRVFKDVCKNCGVSVATDYYVDESMSDEELGQVQFPVVVKPVDASGNRGQSFCFNVDELREGLRHAHEVSNDSCIIVERMLEGPEYTGYYAIADGEPRFLFFTAEHHQPEYASNLYSIKNTTACHLKQYLKDIDEGVKKAFKEIGCSDGIAFVDCMFDKDGHFYVLEMGYRMGGPVLYIMHDKISGFNTIRWILETTLGVKHTEEDLPKELYAYKQCCASYNLFTNQAGLIDSIEGLDKVEALDNVILDMPKRAGNSVREYANMGVIRIIGDNCQDVCDTVEYINSVLFVKNKDGENMFIKFDDFKTLTDEYNEGLKQFGLD